MIFFVFVFVSVYEFKFLIIFWLVKMVSCMYLFNHLIHGEAGDSSFSALVNLPLHCFSSCLVSLISQRLVHSYHCMQRNLW